VQKKPPVLGWRQLMMTISEWTRNMIAQSTAPLHDEGLQFPVAFGHNKTDVDLQLKTLTLEDMAALFSKFREGKEGKKEGDKNGPYIIPAKFGDNYRNSDNIRTWSVATLDLDDKVFATEAMIREQLSGLVYFAHTTHRHLIKVPRVEMWRVYLPYNQPVPPSLHEKIQARLNALFPGTDDCTEKTMQFFYLPSHWPGMGHEARSFNTLGEGELLNPLTFDPAPVKGASRPDEWDGSAPGDKTPKTPGQYSDWLGKMLEGDNLHGNATAVTASMVSRGLDDATIMSVFQAWRPTLEEARDLERVQALFGGELQRLIDGARRFIAKNEPAPGKDFDDFVLSQTADAMEAEMDADKYVIARMAIFGQSTVFYGDSNMGKTLLTIHQVAQQIEDGEIDGSQVYYVNADDHGRGIVQKQRLAEKYGFKMLVPGREGFQANMLRPLLQARVKAGRGGGCVVILDTLKKFTDLMSKREGTAWGNISREFVSAGGTLAALAHTNKHKDDDGNSIYAGTADVVQDCDCAYIIELVDDDIGTRTVVFRNIKARGDVDRKRAFSYTLDVPYQEMFDSVQVIEDQVLERSRERKVFADTLAKHHDAIMHIQSLIREGVTKRRALIDRGYRNTNFSRAFITEVLDEHSGDNLLQGHRWKCSKGPKNSLLYSLLSGGSESCTTGTTEMGESRSAEEWES